MGRGRPKKQVDPMEPNLITKDLISNIVAESIDDSDIYERLDIIFKRLDKIEDRTNQIADCLWRDNGRKIERIESDS